MMTAVIIAVMKEALKMIERMTGLGYSVVGLLRLSCRKCWTTKVKCKLISLICAVWSKLHLRLL